MVVLKFFRAILGLSCLPRQIVFAAAEDSDVVACRELHAQLGNSTILPWQSPYIPLSTENWYVLPSIRFFCTLHWSSPGLEQRGQSRLVLSSQRLYTHFNKLFES